VPQIIKIGQSLPELKLKASGWLLRHRVHIGVLKIAGARVAL